MEPGLTEVRYGRGRQRARQQQGYQGNRKSVGRKDRALPVSHRRQGTFPDPNPP